MSYLYNGVKLPALPEFDKSAYPYAYIIKNTSADRDWEYRLYALSSTAVMVEGSNGVGVAQTGVYGGQSYTLNADKFDWEEPVADRLVLANSYHSDMAPIWCDTDVYYHGTDTLYLAASTPVPVSDWTPDPTSMLMGWLTGRRIAGQRKKQKKLVGYSYNGVVLPELPEWNKEKYPYAYISHKPAWKSYAAYFDTTPAVYSTNGPGWTIDVPYAESTYSEEAIYFTGQWGDVSERTTGSGTFICEEFPNLDNPGLATNHLIWCNHDVVYPDGTVFLAASEPVPVYE